MLSIRFHRVPRAKRTKYVTQDFLEKHLTTRQHSDMMKRKHDPLKKEKRMWKKKMALVILYTFFVCPNWLGS